MKKTIIFLSVSVLCLQITGFAQKARVGISAGASVANQKGSIAGVDQKGVEGKTGFMIGLFVDEPICKKFSFQPGVYYVQKGKTIQKKQDFGLVKSDIFLELRYIEFPLNFVYHTYTGNKSGFFFGVGPSLSLKVPSQIVTKADGTRSEKEVVFGNTAASSFKSFDYGANVLAGYKIHGGTYLSFNYTQGLRNLSPDPIGGDVKNFYFGIQLGIIVNNK